MGAVEIFQDELPQYENSIPSISEFDPRYIPWQLHLVQDMARYDYSRGVHEILVSGAYGSAKSLLGAHQILKHCIKYRRSRVCIARKALPDLKATLFQKILDHIGDDLKFGADYRVIDGTANIIFWNGTEIISRSWADRRAFKVRGLELAVAVIEEAAENDDTDMKAVNELRGRVGRLAHIPEKWMMFLTNPDDPAHWLYKRFFTRKNSLKHVYHSRTLDNPFLDPTYHSGLLEDMDPKMARRLLEGEWLTVAGETVYHQYDPDMHELLWNYKVDPTLPIHFSFDFNIGEGKPMSCVFYQIADGIFHFFAEIVIEGARTIGIMEEAENLGLFEHDTIFYCHGDATAKHGDTRNNISDYVIIDEFMKRLKNSRGQAVKYIREVPVGNPPIRKRHNIVNAYLRNALGVVRVFVYPSCKVLREGFRLVKLRRGAEYQEDDTKFYQHITTAAGYGICWYEMNANRPRSSSRQRI